MASTLSLTQPLKWHGGKHYLAKRIVQLMPRHLHYVEPYFGGGSVLLARDPDDERLWWGTRSHERGVSEVVNDINGELIDFWRVLQAGYLFADFQRLLAATPFSEQEFGRAHNRVSCRAAGTSNLPELEKEYGWRLTRAALFFIRCRQSLAGRMDSFAPLSKTRTRRGMNEQASAWLSVVDGLPAVHERLKRVVILNGHALDVIRKQDGEKTLFYCDPPYLPETRPSRDVYEHEMTEDQHLELLRMLVGIDGKFMLSGYGNQLYSEMANRNKWRRVDFDLPNNAAGGETKRRMTECVWMNY